MTNRNSSNDTDADDLRRSFMLALSDAIKADAKPTAAMLEVARKALADDAAQRRWQVEQAALASASVGNAPRTASEAPGKAQESNHVPTVNGEST
jgi:hypothetical protein